MRVELAFPSALQCCLGLLGVWVLIGLIGLAAPVRLRRSWLYVAGAVVGAALALVAATRLTPAVESAVLPLGLPELPLHVRLDALAAVFLVLLGGCSAGVSLFAAGHVRRSTAVAPGPTSLHYHLFLASMGFVLLADDAYGFMLAWEVMALSSYFLVTTDHHSAAHRQAGWLYLLIAHVGAICILLSFGILQAGDDFSFDAMRGAQLSPAWAASAYLLALFGFGAKAGLVPLHVWLPEAHPAAPSPASALMSGVMLKTALYGLLRVSFDLLGRSDWWWGLLPLALGLFAALYGVIFAAAQTDMKRLLAYSSIENLGILFAGVGLALLFQSAGMTAIAALALLAVLYHALNHACIKGLLFISAGAVLQATGEGDMARLGGLLQRMPWVAWSALIGALALAGLPPLNGFVSEWLLLQAFLFSPQVPGAFLNMLLPLGAALLVLAVALAAYVMVKLFGVVFLGQPRLPSARQPRDATPVQRLGFAWLAAACIGLGLFPAQILPRLRAVTVLLHLGAPAATASGAPWWSLAPIAGRQASYAPLLFLAAISASVLLTIGLVRVFYHQRVRRAAAWDCGYGRLDGRVQDSAEGFGQPVTQIFRSFFDIERELPTPFDHAPRYRTRIQDRFWRGLYLPLGSLVRRTAGAAGTLQPARISLYLLYSFLTLLLVLAFVRWA